MFGNAEGMGQLKAGSPMLEASPRFLPSVAGGRLVLVCGAAGCGACQEAGIVVSPTVCRVGGLLALSLNKNNVPIP